MINELSTTRLDLRSVALVLRNGRAAQNPGETSPIAVRRAVFHLDVNDVLGLDGASAKGLASVASG